MPLPDIDSFDDYGGALNDYLVRPTDPSTDREASGVNKAYLATSQMTRTARRCWARFLGNATTPTIAVANGHDACWGSDVSVKPVPAHSSTGVYTVTFPATTTDALGVVHTTNLRWCKVACEDADGFFRAQITAPNVVTVTAKTTAVALNDFVGNTLFVEAG